jgi:hypothetical protein
VPPSVMNFWQFLVEYIAALYIFLPFIYFDVVVRWINSFTKSSKKSMVYQLLIFSFMLTVIMLEKLGLHTVAGKIWWFRGDTNYNPNDPAYSWMAAFMFNLPIYAITLGIILPIGIVAFPSLIQFRKR